MEHVVDEANGGENNFRFAYLLADVEKYVDQENIVLEKENFYDYTDVDTSSLFGQNHWIYNRVNSIINLNAFINGFTTYPSSMKD